MTADSNTRFILNSRNIRGQIVQLDQVWRDIQSKQAYPKYLAQILGESIAAVSALASTVKLQGSMIAQIQGDGAISTLVAQATNAGHIRGLARLRDEPQAHYASDKAAGETDDKTAFAQLLGEAKLVITIDAEGAQRYQGIVQCTGDNLSAVFNRYFEQSDQLPTRLWLSADQNHAACFLLQQLPGSNDQETKDNDWAHACSLAETLQADEMRGLTPELLLHRLFHEEDVQVYPGQSLCFDCGCSRHKVSAVITGMGEADAMALATQQGEIKADCEFCGQSYHFDKVDVASIFSATQDAPPTAQ